jgi:hypothetical protein
MRKRGWALILVLAMTVSLCAFAQGAGGGRFDDVPPSHWAFASIEELVERKAINGYPDGNFYPEKTVSREEFAKIMVVAAGMTAAPAESSTYADVPLTYWASPYIETARPYMTAYRNQGQLYFYPTAGALREDIAVAVVKMKGLDTRGADASMLEAMFTDLSSISEAALPYVALAVEQGIVTGYTDRIFRGQGTITRGEAAAMLWRAFQKGSGDQVIPDDILPTETPSPTPTPMPSPSVTPTPQPSAVPTPTPTPSPAPTPSPTPEPEVTASGYGLIVDVNVMRHQVMVLSADGVKRTCSVDGPWYNLGEGDLVQFEELADGIRILGRGASVTAGYDSKTKTFGGLGVREDCALFAEVTAASTGDWNGTYKAYALRDLSSIPAQRAVFFLDEEDRVAAVYMDLEQGPTGLSDVVTYGIVSSDNGSVKIDGDVYRSYIVEKNGEAYSVYVSGNILKRGQLVSFRESYNGCYSSEDITIYTDQNILAGCVKQYSGWDRTLSLYTHTVKNEDKGGIFEGQFEGQDRSATYITARDLLIIYVDMDGKRSGDEIGIAAYDTTTGYKNIAVILDENDTVVVAFVETSGMCNILP